LKKISESILYKNWPKNDFDEEDNAYEIPALAYNREMDWLMLANNIPDIEKRS
jgi:hypothetical protein